MSIRDPYFSHRHRTPLLLTRSFAPGYLKVGTCPNVGMDWVASLLAAATVTGPRARPRRHGFALARRPLNFEFSTLISSY